MPREIEILAGVAKTTAADVESPRFGNDARDNENRHETRDDEYAAAIKNARDQGEPAEDLQPRQIKREPDPCLPGQHFVIVDVSGELDWIDDLDRPGVNEESADDDRDETQDDRLH